MSEAEAEYLLEKVRDIMAETGEPFGPAVNIFIRARYGK